MGSSGSEGNWLKRETSLLRKCPISFSSTIFLHDCVQNCSVICCCNHMLSESYSPKFVPLSSFPVTMYSPLSYQWEQQSRQSHLYGKQGWSVRNRKNTGAENTDTLGTSIRRLPGVLSILRVSLSLSYLPNPFPWAGILSAGRSLHHP